MAHASASFRVTDYRALDQAVDPLVADVANTIAADARGRTPVRTGNLRGAWKVIKTAEARHRVVNDVPYARFVEYGANNAPARAMLGQAVASARGTYGRR